jgi:glucose dehydrogenase
MVDGTLYLSTLFNRVIALDPQNATERWSFDPKLDLSIPLHRRIHFLRHLHLA